MYAQNKPHHQEKHQKNDTLRPLKKEQGMSSSISNQGN